LEAIAATMASLPDAINENWLGVEEMFSSFKFPPFRVISREADNF